MNQKKKFHGHIPSPGGSPTNPRMVTHHPKDGHPPNQRWSPTWRKCTTDMEFGTYTLLTKLTHVDNCHEWSPTMLRMVVHQPKDGHPPTLGWSPTRRKCTTDFKFGIYTLLTKKHLMTTVMDGHLPSLGWPPPIQGCSPTYLRMVTHQMEDNNNS